VQRWHSGLQKKARLLSSRISCSKMREIRANNCVDRCSDKIPGYRRYMAMVSRRQRALDEAELVRTLFDQHSLKEGER
jgi:hypothetical protein